MVHAQQHKVVCLQKHNIVCDISVKVKPITQQITSVLDQDFLSEII